MKSYESQSYSRFSAKQTIIDGKLNLQALLNAVVEEVMSTLDVHGCEGIVFKEENSGCEVTSTNGYFPEIHETDRAWSAEYGTKTVVNQKSSAQFHIPIPICWKDRIMGLLKIYPSYKKPLRPYEIRWLHAIASSLAASIRSIQRYAETLEKGETLMNDVWRWFKAPTARDGLTAANHLSPPFVGHRRICL